MTFPLLTEVQCKVRKVLRDLLHHPIGAALELAQKLNPTESQAILTAVATIQDEHEQFSVINKTLQDAAKRWEAEAVAAHKSSRSAILQDLDASGVEYVELPEEIEGQRNPIVAYTETENPPQVVAAPNPPDVAELDPTTITPPAEGPADPAPTPPPE